MLFFLVLVLFHFVFLHLMIISFQVIFYLYISFTYKRMLVFLCLVYVHSV